MIDQERIKKLLSYSDETGVFIWNYRDKDEIPDPKARNLWNKSHAGKEAGTVAVASGSGKKYRLIAIDNKKYRAHRLAWVYMNGDATFGQVDHIDGDGVNNSYENLRVVTNLENHRNCKKQSNNTSGFTGVVYDKRRGLWMARIKIKGTQKHLGYFVNIEDAIEAREAANVNYGFHKNHGSNRGLNKC